MCDSSFPFPGSTEKQIISAALIHSSGDPLPLRPGSQMFMKKKPQQLRVTDCQMQTVSSLARFNTGLSDVLLPNGNLNV